MTSLRSSSASSAGTAPAGNATRGAGVSKPATLTGYMLPSVTLTCFMRSAGCMLAAYSAAPITGASSAFTFTAIFSSGTPAARSAACTAGTRVEPPISTTESMSATVRRVRCSSSWIGATTRASCPASSIARSNCSRVTEVRRSRSCARLST